MNKRAKAMPRRYLFLLFALVVVACSEEPAKDKRAQIIEPPAQQLDVDFPTRILPLLEKRCVHCHACYDAPCQLKLSSSEGIDRGAIDEKIYDGTRLVAAQQTRLYLDAHSSRQWREKGFHSILPELAGTQSPDAQANLLAQVLQHKQDHPLPLTDDGRLQDVFDLTLNRDWHCPLEADYAEYAKAKPYAGMPFALPALADGETTLIRAWLEAGAPMPQASPALEQYRGVIELWETFLNQDSLQGQLVARYIYEHLYLGNLYFPEVSSATYFKLLRSTTPPGVPIHVVATRRPFDDPGVSRVYYRLQPGKGSVVAKTHMPYALDNQRLQRFQALFFNDDYGVSRLPSYKPAEASNPFFTYAQIPSRTRYRFLLEHAEFTIRGFMKGAVCRGQIALNVIDDHFWVFFVSPEHDLSAHLNRVALDNSDLLSLPAEAESEPEPLTNWLRFANLQQNYLDRKSATINGYLDEGNRLGLDYVWDGDGKNQNAQLTVFRHFDSASVRKGLLGQQPKTAWLIDYPVLERIHYLLVAGFDVYGNLGHQLLTRLYMDFLRMESQFTFLSLLPVDERARLRDHWYRDAQKDIKAYLHGHHAAIKYEPGIEYHSGNPKRELFEHLRDRLTPVISQKHQPESLELPPKQMAALQRITSARGNSASLMPESSLVLITGEPPRLVTLLRTSAHSNVSELFDEAARRIPAEDAVVIVAGVVGAYPDALWQVAADELETFVELVVTLENEQDYRRLMMRFGLRRSNPEFWRYSDNIHAIYRQSDPVGYGILDYSRLENR